MKNKKRDMKHEDKKNNDKRCYDDDKRYNDDKRHYDEDDDMYIKHHSESYESDCDYDDCDDSSHE